MAIFGLKFNHFGKVLKGFLVLISKQVAFGPLVDIARLIVSQLDSLSERGQRFFEHFKVGVRDTEMIIDICLISLERMVVQRSEQILDGQFELFVLVIGQSSFVENLGVSRFAG